MHYDEFFKGLRLSEKQHPVSKLFFKGQLKGTLRTISALEIRHGVEFNSQN